MLRNRRNADFDYESEPLISDNKDDAVGKIKRAVGAVDKLSIRIGILLKRYPTLRLLGMRLYSRVKTTYNFENLFQFLKISSVYFLKIQDYSLGKQILQIEI